MKLDRRSLLVGSAGVLLAGRLDAQEKDRSYLAVWATTRNMILPGAPGLPPGVDLNQLPEEARQALAGLFGPQKDLEVRLWSQGPAPADATAALDVPSVLNLGPTLPLEINRPAQRQEEARKNAAAAGQFQVPDFEIRQYWKCSETVLPGQPKIWRTSELAGKMKEDFGRFAGGAGYIEKPDWTEAVWPNSKAGPGAIPGAPGGPRARPGGNRPRGGGIPGVPGGVPGGIPGGAPGGFPGAPGVPRKPGSLLGQHTLKTSYVGNASFTVSQADFLAPVELTSPAGGAKPNLKSSIRLAWKPIPNVLGYEVFAMGMRGQKTMIIWSAAGVEGPVMGAGGGFPQMAEVREMVQSGRALAPDHTSCNVPAGIFEGVQGAMLQIVAYGPGQAFEEPGKPAIRVQTRSMAMMPLGGPDFGDR